MRVELLSIFPRIFSGFLTESLIAKAIAKDLVSINVTDIRDFAAPPHFSLDDTPYGGGAGMVMMVEPLVKAVEEVKKRMPKARTVLLTPAGARFTQIKAQEFARQEELIFICGRYEGVDERVCELVVDEQLSIGDYVLMGGEVAAMVVLESVFRLIPSVIGNSSSLERESFTATSQLLEAPQFTRPAEYRGLKVPEVLLSGNHAQIKSWRAEQSRKRTRERRPDLILAADKEQA